MAGSIDKAKICLDDVLEQLNRIELHPIPTSTTALIRATRALTKTVRMLLDNAKPTNDR